MLHSALRKASFQPAALPMLPAQRLACLLAAAAARSTAAAAPPPAEAASLLASAARLLSGARQPVCLRHLHATPVQRSEEGEDLQRKARINRMLYRSRQRGFLELDLLIGMWAEKELPGMSTDMIQEFEVVLDQENPDMFKWLTGQAEPPEPLLQNRVFTMLRQHVKGMTDQHHSVPPPPHSEGEAPKEWVRGWTDSGKEMGPAPAPAQPQS